MQTYPPPPSQDPADPLAHAPEFVAPPSDPTLSDRRSNPVSSETDTQPIRPPMTATEASWHTTVAARRADHAARTGGTDAGERAVAALGEAAVGGIVIGGLTLQRPSAFSSYAVQAAAKLLASQEIDALTDQGVMIYCFADPRGAYDLAAVKKDAAALLSRAQKVVLELEFSEHIAAATAWCLDAFAALNGVKKPSSEPAATPAPVPHPMPTPANGSPTSPASSANPPQTAPRGS